MICITPKQVIKLWEALPSTKATAKKQGLNEWRSLTTAKKYAKMVNRKWANGSYFKSMGEVYLVEELRKLKSERKIKGFTYEPEVWKYQYEPQEYSVDFNIIKNNNDIIFIEYKGKMDAPIRKKLEAIKRCNPDKELFIIFERGNNKISSNSKTTYLEWANKHGFNCSHKIIESDWLK